MAKAGGKAGHEKAFTLLSAAVKDPGKIAAAKRHPLLKPILAKLSADDLDTLSDIAQNQESTVCPP